MCFANLYAYGLAIHILLVILKGIQLFLHKLFSIFLNDRIKNLFRRKKNCRYFYRQLVIEATRSSVRYSRYFIGRAIRYFVSLHSPELALPSLLVVRPEHVQGWMFLPQSPHLLFVLLLQRGL